MSKSFKINPKSKATFGQCKLLAMTFKDCHGKDIKYGTILGHFIAKMNAEKNALTQGQVQDYLSKKKLPQADVQSMRRYKKKMATS